MRNIKKAGQLRQCLLPARLNRIVRSSSQVKACAAIILCFTFLGIQLFWGAETALAANDQKVADTADLLSVSEAEALQEYLGSISEKYQCDVVAATTDSFDGKGRQDYTDDFYCENGYGYGTDTDGILLMINMEDREYQYSTWGSAISVFTDYGLEKIDEQVTPYLKKGDVYQAFRTYGELAEEFLQEAESAVPYDRNHPYGAEEAAADHYRDQEEGGRYQDHGSRDHEKRSMAAQAGTALAAGAAVTFVVLFVLVRQLRTVRAKNRAQDYIREGSFRITRMNDLFLYRTVTRRKIERPENNGPGGSGGSTIHTTSSGRSAGGRGGSF